MKARSSSRGCGIFVLLTASCASGTGSRDGGGAGTAGTGSAGDSGGSPMLGSGGSGAAGAASGGGGSGGGAGAATAGTTGLGGLAGSGGVGAEGGQSDGGVGASVGGAGTGAASGSAGAGGAPGSGGLAGASGASGTSAGGDAAGGGGAAAGGGAGAGPVGCDWSNAEGRIVLFDGTDLADWRNATTEGAAHWRLVGDGSMEVVPMNPSANLETVMPFEDLCLHLEYMTPMYAENVTGQQRGNSGVYFKRAYEMQVLDTYGHPPAIDGCGAVYSVSPPLVVACNAQLVWNTYEIEFKASVWSTSGTKLENAVFVSATLNGTVVQRDVELDVSATTAGDPDVRGPRSLMLQDHGNAVRFRNVWAKVPRY